MSKCKLVYLDKYGERSAAYYGNLHLGHSVAEKLYMESMASEALVNFHKTKMSINDMLAFSRSIDLPTEERNTYRLPNGKELGRMTEFLGKVTGKDFRDVEVAKKVARTQYAKSLLFKDPEKYNTTEVELKKLKGDFKDLRNIKLKDYPQAEKDADTWIADPANESAYDAKWGKILSLWDHKREAGTDIHDLIERYILERNKLTPDSEGWMDLESAETNALGDMDYPDDHRNLLKQIETFLMSVGSGRKITFEPEVCLWDEELEIAGRIDLLAFDDEGRAYIFDYKTKETDTEFKFDQRFDHMPDPISELYANKETDGALQTSGYRLILERMGINVVESKILYIEADVIDEGDKYRYANFNHKKDVHLRYYRSQLGKIFKKTVGKDINSQRKIEPGTFSTVNDIMEYISGDEAIEHTSSIATKVSYRLNRVQTNKDGRDYFWNELDSKNEYYKSTSVVERKKQLTAYFTRMKDSDPVNKLSSGVIDFFNGGQELWNSGVTKSKQSSVELSKAIQARTLLSGLNRDTHTLEKINNIYGFEDVGASMILAVEKATGEAKIINISSKKSTSIELNDSSKNTKSHRTIFGKFMSDRSIQTKYGIEGLSSTTSNLRLLNGGLIAMELKQQGIIKSVSAIVNGTVSGFETNSEIPQAISMRDILANVKILKDLSKKSGIQSSHYDKLFSDKKLNNPSNWKNNTIDELYRLINGGLTDLRKGDANALSESITRFRGGKIRQEELVKELMANRKLLAESLVDKSGTTDDSSRSLSQHRDYVLLCRAIMEYVGIELEIGDYSKKLSWDKSYRTSSRIANQAVAQLDWQVKNDKQNLSRNFKEWNNEHKALVRELKSGNNGSNKNLFNNMYLTDATLNRSKETDISKLHDLFKLKDPKDKSLSTAESKYIVFFNKAVKDGYMSITNKKEQAQIEDGTLWEEGSVPLLIKSGRSRIEEEKNIASRIKLILQNSVNKDMKNTEDTFDEISAFIASKYSNQLGVGKIKEGRMNMLGLDAEGERKNNRDPKDMETNLEHILNNFKKESSRIVEFETTLGAYNAMNMIAYIDQNEFFNSSKETREFMDNYIKMVVLEEYKDEGKAGKTLDKVGSAVSKAAFSYSLSQPLLEGATNLFASTSAVLSQTMLGKQKRFSFKDWVKAGGKIIADRSKGFTPKDGSVAEAIVSTFGLYGSDAGALGTTEFQEARAKMTASKAGFYLNNLPFKMFRTQAFIAELNRKGITKSLSVDKVGNLTYDYTKDARFEGIFDHKGDVRTDLAGNQTLIEKKGFYDLLVKELGKEGGLDENGKPTRPIFNAEAISMLDYSRSLFGSMDSDSRLQVQRHAIGRQLVKFKSWAASKKDNYWTKKDMTKTTGYSTWVKDESHPDGGYADFQQASMEGILNTLISLGKDFGSILKEEASDKGKWGDIKDVATSLDKKQKENLARLTSDMILLAVLLSVMGALFDDEYWKKGEGLMVAKTLHNAAMDLNIVNIAGSMSSSSPFATIGYAQRTLGAAWNGIGYMATGEGDKGLERFASVTGTTKNIYSFFE